MYQVPIRSSFARLCHFRFLLSFNGGPAALSSRRRPELNTDASVANGTLPQISGRVLAPSGCSVARTAVGTYVITGLPKVERAVAYSTPGGAAQKGSFMVSSYTPNTGTCTLIHRGADGIAADVASNANSVACIMIVADCGGPRGSIEV